MSDDDDKWWFCLRHNTVEQGSVCANSERMGPYDTREEAENALAHAAERTEAWDSDPRWKDDD
ncbi:MAG TPA: hypothetical protein VF227_04930 [Actinomycetes bacterium]|jgi:hypothetical protein